MTVSQWGIVHLELTRRCNLRCVYCAVSQPRYAASAMDMSAELRDRAVAALLQLRPRTICLNGHGETTMLPWWPDVARPFLDASIPLTMITNLSKDYSDAEIDQLCRFRSLTVSLDTVDEDLLRRTRRSVSLERMEETLGRLRSCSRRPEVEISCVVHDKNVHELELFTTVMTSIWGIRNLTFCSLTKYPDLPDAMNVQSVAQLPHEERVILLGQFQRLVARLQEKGCRVTVQAGIWGEMNTEAAPTPYMPLQGRTRDCLDPWTFLIIHANGDVCPCCWQERIGNLQMQTLPEILEDGRLQQLRRQLVTGNLDKVCRQCPARATIEPRELDRQLQVHGLYPAGR